MTRAVLLILLGASAGAAQTTAPTFEVATVKLVSDPKIPSFLPVANRCSGGPASKTPGKFECKETDLKGLIAEAYGIPASRITGSDLHDSARYDVNARLDPATTPEAFRQMLQALLADRFALKLHRESKSTPVYVLTVAKNGPKLQAPHNTVEYADDKERQEAARAKGQEMMEAMKARMAAGGVKNMNINTLANGTVAQFAEQISRRLDREIIDRTGLTEKYSFDLSWSNDVDASGIPSLFGAFQEQLGLKLTSAKEDLEILIVDHAEKTPTGN